MGGMGPAPKPDDQRRRRNAPTFDWVDLPADGRHGEPPELPTWRKWSAETRQWWAAIWSLPEATRWHSSGVTLWPLAELHEQLVHGETPPHTVLNAMLPRERDHGFSPAALQQRRWRVTPTLIQGGKVDDEPSTFAEPSDGQRQPRAAASVSRLRLAATPEPPKRPTRRDDRDAWVKFGLALGDSHAELVELTKAELMRRYPAPRKGK